MNDPNSTTIAHQICLGLSSNQMIVAVMNFAVMNFAKPVLSRIALNVLPTFILTPNRGVGTYHYCEKF